MVSMYRDCHRCDKPAWVMGRVVTGMVQGSNFLPDVNPYPKPKSTWVYGFFISKLKLLYSHNNDIF